MNHVGISFCIQEVQALSIADLHATMLFSKMMKETSLQVPAQESQFDEMRGWALLESTAKKELRDRIRKVFKHGVVPPLPEDWSEDDILP